MGCGCPFTYKEALKDVGVSESEATAEAWKAYYMTDKEFADYSKMECIRNIKNNGGSKIAIQRMCASMVASRNESASSSCVSAKIKIIKKHHPEMKQAQLVAYATNWCKTHGNKPQ